MSNKNTKKDEGGGSPYFNKMRELRTAIHELFDEFATKLDNPLMVGVFVVLSFLFSIIAIVLSSISLNDSTNYGLLLSSEIFIVLSLALLALIRPLLNFLRCNISETRWECSPKPVAMGTRLLNILAIILYISLSVLALVKLILPSGPVRNLSVSVLLFIPVGFAVSVPIILRLTNKMALERILMRLNKLISKKKSSQGRKRTTVSTARGGGEGQQKSTGFFKNISDFLSEIF